MYLERQLDNHIILQKLVHIPLAQAYQFSLGIYVYILHNVLLIQTSKVAVCSVVRSLFTRLLYRSPNIMIDPNTFEHFSIHVFWNMLDRKFI